jgi:large subunit ribosomal protein L15
MQIHELTPQSSFKEKKRVGRGGKRGTYSGKGQNGQKSRAGARFQPIVREWLKKYPKLRGYRFGIRDEKPLAINLAVIEKNYNDGEVVSLETLNQKGIIRKSVKKVKVLGQGEFTKKIIIEGIAVSKSVKELVEKNKGEVK